MTVKVRELSFVFMDSVSVAMLSLVNVLFCTNFFFSTANTSHTCNFRTKYGLHSDLGTKLSVSSLFCICLCVYYGKAHMWVQRGQLKRVDSLLPPWGSQKPSWDHHPWQQVLYSLWAITHAKQYNLNGDFHVAISLNNLHKRGVLQQFLIMFFLESCHKNHKEYERMPAPLFFLCLKHKPLHFTPCFTSTCEFKKGVLSFK